MAIRRPPLFTDSDTLAFRQTPPSECRISCTFVESLNEGTLFERSAQTNREADVLRDITDLLGNQQTMSFD
jgi:hypothetical protein